MSDAQSDAWELSEPTGCCLMRAWRSEIVLSARAAAACEDAYTMHQLVRKGTAPNGNRPGQEHVLYAAHRVVSDGHRSLGLAGRPVSLLVQTTHAPDWNGLLRAGTLVSASTERVEQAWRRGERAEIQVRASPVVCRNDASGRSRKLLLSGRQDCGRWFREHLERAGCRPITPTIGVAAAEQTRQQGWTITFRLFWATVKVADPPRFRRLLLSGMGRNRNWGAGMVLARHGGGSDELLSTGP